MRFEEKYLQKNIDVNSIHPLLKRELSNSRKLRRDHLLAILAIGLPQSHLHPHYHIGGGYEGGGAHWDKSSNNVYFHFLLIMKW